MIIYKQSLKVIDKLVKIRTYNYRCCDSKQSNWMWDRLRVSIRMRKGRKIDNNKCNNRDNRVIKNMQVDIASLGNKYFRVGLPLSLSTLSLNKQLYKSIRYNSLSKIYKQSTKNSNFSILLSTVFPITKEIKQPKQFE